MSLKTVVTALVAAALGASLVACNTIGGIGEDISAGGKGLAKAAHKVQGKDDKKSQDKK